MCEPWEVAAVVKRAQGRNKEKGIKGSLDLLLWSFGSVWALLRRGGTHANHFRPGSHMRAAVLMLLWHYKGWQRLPKQLLALDAKAKAKAEAKATSRRRSTFQCNFCIRNSFPQQTRRRRRLGAWQQQLVRSWQADGLPSARLPKAKRCPRKVKSSVVVESNLLMSSITGCLRRGLELLVPWIHQLFTTHVLRIHH